MSPARARVAQPARVNFAPCVSAPFVRVRCLGNTHDLLPGDVIGRGRAASLSIDDGRVSEAHALVSLRGGELKLLALRGRFVLGERPCAETVLSRGQCISLAPGVALEVVEVRLPSLALALRSPHLPRTILMGVCSLETPDSDRLTPGFRRDAAAQIWNQEADWRIRVGNEPARPLDAGDVLDIDGVPLEAVSITLDEAGAKATQLDAKTCRALSIVTNHDTVTIERSDGQLLHLSGISARIVSELAAFDGPASWDVLAGEVWEESYERALLRRKWDVAVARLRKRLRDAGIPPEIVVADGTGNFELVLSSTDRIDARG